MNTETPSSQWPTAPAGGQQWRGVSTPVIKQFIQYAFAGAIAFVGDFAMFYLALQVGIHYLIATSLGFCVGLLCNFMLCITWIWRGTSATKPKDFIVFSAIGLAGLGIATSFMWLLVETAHIAPLIAKILTSAVVLIWNFTLRKLLVFYR